MVREYVERLYLPAAASAQWASADGYAGAMGLAQWKERIRGCWPGLAVEHVEADGVGDAVSTGTAITVRAYVHLGELGPDDVVVQLVHGRVDADDRFAAAQRTAMAPIDQVEGNRWQYRADLTLDASGPFGYTVRIVPTHPGLASVDEMGLQVLPSSAG